jgi:hypothetical protein
MSFIWIVVLVSLIDAALPTRLGVASAAVAMVDDHLGATSTTTYFFEASLWKKNFNKKYIPSKGRQSLTNFSYKIHVKQYSLPALRRAGPILLVKKPPPP